MSDYVFDLSLHNQTLKSEFAMRGLDLHQVWTPTPDDLALENRQLEHLLDWVEKYDSCPDRAQMEAEGYEFPPIQPGIEPDSDWLAFELWIQHKPVRAKMKEQLHSPPGISPGKLLKRDPRQMTDEEIEAKLKQFYACLQEANFSVDLNEGLPARFVYTIVQEALEEEFEFIVGGCWHIDGCNGYCPGCLQRPWCESGQELCWPEDEKTGEMCFPAAIRQYVSPSPLSLALLKKSQAEHDRRMKPYLNSDSPF